MTTVPLPDEILDVWAKHLVPALDVWYWTGDAPDIDLSGCMVLTRQDYLSHPEFQHIAFVSAYCHWQLPEDVSHVIVSSADWILHLNADHRKNIVEKQVELKRGLVMPLSFFDRVPAQIQPFISGDAAVLCHAAWAEVPATTQRTILRHEQRRWDDLDCFPASSDLPPHIAAIANRFGVDEGANCLGTTAFCLTAEDWMRRHWMFQAPFVEIISRHGYRPVSHVSPEPGDIATFQIDEAIAHAAFCIGNDRFLNKNGQSRFNPVRIVDSSFLQRDWENATLTIWRCRNTVEAL